VLSQQARVGRITLSQFSRSSAAESGGILFVTDSARIGELSATNMSDSRYGSFDVWFLTSTRMQTVLFEVLFKYSKNS
jgi:hypothetical protein